MYENKKQKLDLIETKINTLIIHKLETSKQLFEHLKKNHILKNPQEIFEPKAIILKQIIEKLELLNPLGILKRGYTLTYQNNHIIKSISDIKEDSIEIRLYDGTVKAKVVEKEKK